MNHALKALTAAANRYKGISHMDMGLDQLKALEEVHAEVWNIDRDQLNDEHTVYLIGLLGHIQNNLHAYKTAMAA